jgi:hypothetical protein
VFDSLIGLCHRRYSLKGPRSKAEFYPRWINLEFGNRLHIFNSWYNLQASDYDGQVSIRYKDASANQWKKYYVPRNDVFIHLAEFVKQGAELSKFTFNESAPDNSLLIQGELAYLTNGLYLYYSVLRAPMREALNREPREAYNLRAKNILRSLLFPQSYDMLIELNELYPNSVIEFSAYSIPLGVLPNHSVVTWEVREY